MLHASITKEELQSINEPYQSALQSISDNTIMSDYLASVTPIKLYAVHNHNTNTNCILTQPELEASWTDIKSGTLEIIDEIDPTYKS